MALAMTDEQLGLCTDPKTPMVTAGPRSVWKTCEGRTIGRNPDL